MAEDNALIEDDEDDSKAEYVAVEKPLVEDDEEDNTLKTSSEEQDASSEEDREAIRERRRLEKKERKERRDKAIDRDKIELTFLRNRNDELERRVDAVEHQATKATLSDADRLITEATNDVETAERIIAKAVAAGNGEDVTKAMRYRDQARAKAQQLKYVKDQAVQRPVAPAQQVDDLTMHYAKKFLDDNKWYDPQGRDEESAIMLAIDQALVKDGLNPQTEEYWDELNKRAS